MDGTQQLVAVGGLGLVAVNFWTSKQRPLIGGVIFGDAGNNPSAGHQAMLGIGGELLLVFILTMVAGQSDSLAAGMGAIVAALWVLWAMRHYSSTPAKYIAGPSVPNTTLA